MKYAIVQFAGSNCDRDCLAALASLRDAQATFVWHKASQLPTDVDAVILPGGFSYGDYLRAGAIAAHAPIMRAVKAFAHDGGVVLGICNGFQILTETGLLPGTLLRNHSLQFVCRPVSLRIEHHRSRFTCAYHQSVLTMPIAHMDGCYYADPATCAVLEANGQILFRYCTADGVISPAANPNGSCENIAGICNEKGNVLGMMPHPERVMDALLGGCDGAGIFRSLQEW